MHDGGEACTIWDAGRLYPLLVSGLSICVPCLLFGQILVEGGRVLEGKVGERVEERDGGVGDVITLSGGFMPQQMYDLQYGKSKVQYRDGR